MAVIGFPVFSFVVVRDEPSGRNLILRFLGVALPARRYNVWASPAVGDVPLFVFDLRFPHVSGQTLVITNVPVALPAGLYDVYYNPRVAIEGGGGFGVSAETGGYLCLEAAT